MSVALPLMAPDVAVTLAGSRGETRGQAGSTDRRDTGRQGTPGHASQSLLGSVAICTGGRKLLRGAYVHRGGGRRDGNRYQDGGRARSRKSKWLLGGVDRVVGEDQAAGPGSGRRSE